MATLGWDFGLRQPRNCVFNLVEDRVESAGLFGQTRTPSRRFTRWSALMVWPVTDNTQQRRLQGFLSRAVGGYDVINVPMFDYRAQRGTKTGTVTFLGAHAIGDTSWTVAGGSGQFMSGDRIMPATTVSGGLAHAYIVRQGEDALGAGNISVWPPLRRAYANGNSIIKTVTPSTDTWIMENMEIVGDPEWGQVRPGAATIGYFEQFAIEWRSALR